MAEKTITIKLVRSPYGHKPNQVKTLKALGLTKTNQVITKVDNEAVRGMIATVKHLVAVFPCPEPVPRPTLFLECLAPSTTCNSCNFMLFLLFYYCN